MSNETNKEIMKFVEEGIFESGKAYFAIRAFEKYIQDAYTDLIYSFPWDEYDMTPDYESSKMTFSQRKIIGDWLFFRIIIKRSNKKGQILHLQYTSSTSSSINIQGFWGTSKNMNYNDYDKKMFKIVKSGDGPRVQIDLQEKDKDTFNFIKYYTMIIEVMVKHADQLN